MSGSDFATITPGKSLTSFTPPGGYFIRSLRIDNLSGCWYQIANNLQIIPPFTSGLVVQLDAGTQSLSINFLTQVAGQASKLIGNPVQVFMTEDRLSPQQAISIANAIPYVNTFFAQAVTTGFPGGLNPFALFSIFPSVGMRIRIRYVEISEAIASTSSGDIVLGIYLITTAGAGPIVAVQGQDADSGVVSQCTVRSNMPNGGAMPTLGANLFPSIIMRTDTSLGAYARAFYSFDLEGPDMPPTAYAITGNLKGLALATPTSGRDGSLQGSIGWTEEPITT